MGGSCTDSPTNTPISKRSMIMANEQRIEHVDPNMIVDPKIKEPDVQFYDVREEPFKVYGLYN